MNRYFKWFLVIAAGVAVGYWIAWQLIRREKDYAMLRAAKVWEDRPQIGFAPVPLPLAA